MCSLWGVADHNRRGVGAGNGLLLPQRSIDLSAESMETQCKGRVSAAARRAIDGALSRDRGRLQGLWSRWNAQARRCQGTGGVRAALQRRSQRARRVRRRCRQRAVDPALPIATRSRAHRRTDPHAPGGGDRRRNRFGQDHAVAEAVPGRRSRRGRHDRLHAAAPHRRARGRAARRRGIAGAAGRRGRLPGALQRQRQRADRGQVHDRRHPAGRDPVRPLAVGTTTR